MLAAVCMPPELLKTSKMMPNKKLAKRSPYLFPFTGYNMIKRR
jgi:hypothetical protein